MLHGRVPPLTLGSGRLLRWRRRRGRREPRRRRVAWIGQGQRHRGRRRDSELCRKDEEASTIDISSLFRTFISDHHQSPTLPSKINHYRHVQDIRVSALILSGPQNNPPVL